MINVKEWLLGVVAVSLAILLLFLFDFPYLSQYYAPDYHILHKSLLREYFLQFALSLYIFGCASEDLQ